jgi:hypothetical protein
MCKEDGRWRDPLIYGLCLRNMAIIKRFQQKYADAQIYLIEAEKYEVDLNHQGRLPSIYEAWGDLDWDRGNRRAAKGHYENALAKLDTLEEPEEAQEVQRKRIQRRLVGLATYSHLHLSAEHEHEQVWHDWGKAIRELIRLVDEALWTTAIAPHTTQDMDETWIRELAEFEQLSGSRILAQNGLSMSLAKTLGLREETAVAHIHAVRYETLLRQLASPDADVTHDLCCRPAVEGAMSVPHHYARARGASRLLRNPTGTYRLDAGVFSLPLGFAVKGSRVLIELPPQTVKRWNMRIRPFLAEYGRARQLCYRFENPRLAQVLRDHFPVLVSLARYSNADIENPDSDEDSTQAWLDELLNQWKAPIPAI